MSWQAVVIAALVDLKEQEAAAGELQECRRSSSGELQECRWSNSGGELQMEQQRW
jgi:hypothetical protein